jgi:2-deoxy-D-gluconate 3-dehydrogenase
MVEDPFSVKGRVCLVTGASAGLGSHMADFLASRGAKVLGASRTDVASTGDAVYHVNCDINISDNVIAAFDAAEQRFGPVDVVVNNAGIADFSRAEETGDEMIRDLFETNVLGTAKVTREAFRRMRKRGKGGSIIHVTSVLAGKPVSGTAIYGATKAALEQLTRAQAAEWGRHGIRVNAISPGWFPTGMTSPHLDNGLGGLLKARIPLRRLGEARDLDGALLLLASGASRYMTGSVVTVDGGFSAAL